MVNIDSVTKYTYPAVGLLFLAGVVVSYFAAAWVTSISWLLGVVTFAMFGLIAYSREFEVRGGITGAVMVALLGILLLVIGLGAFGLDIGSVAAASIGGITPALPALLKVIAGAAGVGFVLWGTIGAVKEIT